MHMVRDEVDTPEPDIEDIDSTLEKIDDQLVTLSLVPESTEKTETTEPTENAENAETPETAVVVAGPKTPQKRHWRRRNLALEFAPGEAVAVTRRLYRSGESEYLLNDKICRLRDIQDLFSGTGLAGGHYAIIEQGRIGQILSAKPMDRRTIIEEAAGITKFRVRQRATEARLESARSNLSRISDIVSEIDRQVNSLRRQAAKARRYGVLREELRELLRHVYVAEDQQARCSSRRDEREAFGSYRTGARDRVGPKPTRRSRSLGDSRSTQYRRRAFKCARRRSRSRVATRSPGA